MIKLKLFFVTTFLIFSLAFTKENPTLEILVKEQQKFDYICDSLPKKDSIDSKQVMKKKNRKKLLSLKIN